MKLCDCFVCFINFVISTIYTEKRTIFSHQYYFFLLFFIPTDILLFINDFKFNFEFFCSQHYFGISIILKTTSKVRDIAMWLEKRRFSLTWVRKMAWFCLWAPSKRWYAGWETQRAPFQTKVWRVSQSKGSVSAVKNQFSGDHTLPKAAQIWWVRLGYKTRPFWPDIGHSDG